MFVLVLLYLIVAILMFRSRFAAVRSKQLPIKYFRAMSGVVQIPDSVAIPARQFTNLFELPMLFFIACITAMILQLNGPVLVGLAWAFVGCRYAQALVHLTYNNVLHRMVIYAAGLLILMTMWTLLVVWAT